MNGPGYRKHPQAAHTSKTWHNRQSDKAGWIYRNTIYIFYNEKKTKKQTLTLTGQKWTNGKLICIVWGFISLMEELGTFGLFYAIVK